MILLNPNEISFPDPALLESDSGIIAVGGDLSVERLYFAYQLGLFPWYNPAEEILWWCPDPRFVLFPKDLKISKSMRKVLRDEVFTFTENKCFRKVIEECQNTFRKDQDGTWLSEELVVSIVKLHEAGIAKSIEVWQNEDLVGGFYGIQIGKVFCGESMFSKVSNASKAGFIQFIQSQKEGLELIDCQIHSEHLESLGATMISKKDYLKILKNNNDES
ncbi:leucyl/phenylalanyl-tRNA--protein transferase [Kaistella antarctica]|uniref:Leucyl/phenylalanyl-tRNA--protein transferase n=1 Tax=Kaistella antarctica TaxID=266748 RepID=A0A448NTA3_9FLAO|nr:leucyl/phenylalanyl-tRNA--protein transferase [Kaistella antarctica]KEY18117.1 leucyl/phenylalanyl-tRNA--protein transferase [Kaistella antarctica]SEV82843.1 leucyl/phenylalanyl-tRNA--protein transferase [Kaistella antarctica]VEI00708.1 Leucyl/phenylalanyl-tRNA--protein transferase [Kaistella antarctica]